MPEAGGGSAGTQPARQPGSGRGGAIWHRPLWLTGDLCERQKNRPRVFAVAGVSIENGKRILTVTPDLQGEEESSKITSLWLKLEYVERWLKEGVSMVRFQRNDAILEIELAEVTADWFALSSEDAKITFFVFTLDPGDEGVLVEVNALTDDQKFAAEALSGVTLKWADAEYTIIENGRYGME